MSVIPARGRLGRENCPKFQVSVGYIVGSQKKKKKKLSHSFSDSKRPPHRTPRETAVCRLTILTLLPSVQTHFIKVLQTHAAASRSRSLCYHCPFLDGPFLAPHDGSIVILVILGASAHRSPFQSPALTTVSKVHLSIIHFCLSPQNMYYTVSLETGPR